jgi:hypothetical protein
LGTTKSKLAGVATSSTRAHLDDLNGAGARMRLDAAALRPGIGVVMVTDVGGQQTVAGLVDDQADVAADARRPEIGVLALVDAVQLEAVAGRVHLEIEDTGLYGFLVVAGQAIERRSEGVGDQEVHRPTLRTPSSPRPQSG